MPYRGIYRRMIAIAEAWPLATEAAFSSATLHLGRARVGVLDESTHQLALTLEDELRVKSGGMSLGSLERLRDGAWFGEGEPDPEHPARVQLAHHLARLADQYLETSGAEVVPRRRGLLQAPDDALARWRWISLHLPADLLIAAKTALSATEPTVDRVTLTTPECRTVLSRPVAETHLHAKAAFGFPLLWTAWTRWFAEGALPSLELDETQQVPFSDTRRFVGLIALACTARLLLASFLSQRESHPSLSFAAFCDGPLGEICADAGWSRGPSDLKRECLSALAALADGRPDADWQQVASAYHVLAGTPAPRWIWTQDEIAQGDPLAKLLEVSPTLALPETRFASRALRYLLHERREDSAFATVFWQYERIRCVAFRFLVEEAGTAGLDWFQRHFARISGLRAPLQSALFDATFKSTSKGLNLRAIELRLTPGKDTEDIHDDVRKVLEAATTWSAADGKRPEVGIVFHFLKERALAGDRTRLHADPSREGSGFRFGTWLRARRDEAGAIEEFLSRHPAALMVVRGLDMAGSELAVPTWVTVGLLTSLRRASAGIAWRLRKQDAGWPVRPLQVTYHAGEEYQRLVEGLRRIHELIEFKVVRRRDRIGHGLALGADPQIWVQQTPEMYQPAEDRLDDLLWELDRYRTGDLPTLPQRQRYAESQANALATELYEAEFSVEVLLDARRLRHHPGWLAWLGFPDRLLPRRSLETPVALLQQYLTDPGVHRRGQRLVRVIAGEEGELEMLIAAQTWLASKIAALGITLEVNPSSNLLIANMQGFEKHPVFARSAPRSKFSINSDDPLTFATTLADEYAYFHGALQSPNAKGIDGHDRLDELRENGWRSRFTLEASADLEAIEYVLWNMSR